MSGLVLRQSEPVARKPHRCWLCSRVIDAGEKYVRAVWIDDDAGFCDLAQCAHCLALYRLYGDEFIWDHHEGYSADDVRDWDPETAGGCMAQALFREEWRDHRGDLYPVPTDA